MRCEIEWESEMKQKQLISIKLSDYEAIINIS